MRRSTAFLWMVTVGCGSPASDDPDDVPQQDTLVGEEPHTAPSSCSFHLACDAGPFAPGAALPTVEALAVVDGAGHLAWRLVAADALADDGGWSSMRNSGDGSQGWIEDETAPADPGTYVLQVRAGADPAGSTGWTTCAARGALETDGSSVTCDAPDDPPPGFDAATMRAIRVE